jgi:hypothetical protein
MHKLKTQNVNAEIVKLQQACERTNMGSGTVRRLADECGASLKIGKLYRIDINKLLDYIRTFKA